MFEHFSWAGAARYDGKTWKMYSAYDGLAQNRIRSMIAERDVITDNGLSANKVASIAEISGGAVRFDGTSSKTFTTEDGLVSNRVLSVLEDSAGHIWFGTPGGVSRTDGLVI